MNYSKRGTAERLRETNSTSRKLRTKAGVSLLAMCLIAAVLIGSIGVSAGLGAYQSIIDSAPDIQDINVSPEGFATNIYDREGNLIQTLVQAGSNRELRSYSDFPQDLIDAFVAIEDARFWMHQGIDIKGIIRAGTLGLQSGSFDQGASTITQQLIKNNVFDGGSEDNLGDRITRKLQEQYLALELEKNLSKQMILEYYLNTINLGSNTLGVQAASMRYFGKDVSDLNLSECATIAAITQSPYSLNPITHPEKNAERRALVLQYMYEQGKISQEEWDEALEDNVYERIQNVNTSVLESSSPYSYFVDELIRQVLSDLQTKLGYSEAQARNRLYSGGLKIISTQDPKVQAIVDEVINNPENYKNTKDEYLDALSFTYQLTITHADGTTTNYSEGHIRQYYHNVKNNTTFQLVFSNEEDIRACIEEFKAYVLETGEEGDTIWGDNLDITLQPQTSMVVMEQRSGHVAAIIGGRGPKTASLSLNRATRTTRQPGSTFKVLAAFAPALDACGSTLATTYYDEPYSYFGQPITNWWDNRNGSYYGGYGSIREAIIYSSNILATRCLMETVTPELGMQYLKNFGFTTMDDENDTGLTLALGGIYNGVTNLELTAAYASIANGGVYTEPIFYTRILDNNGRVLLENTPETHRVVKETTAWLLADAMRDETYIHRQYYRGENGEKNVSSSGLDMNFDDMYVAGKSGTTTATKDVWFTGFTPYYTATIWCGYDNNISMGDLSTGSFHRRMWREVMQRINEGKENIGNPMPNSIVEARICSLSGRLAIDGVCDRDPEGSQVTTEYFAPCTVPTESCNCHVVVTICNESGQLAGEDCPMEQRFDRIFRILPTMQVTADSPFGLPQDFLENNVCYIHSGGYYPEGSDLWWANSYYVPEPEGEGDSDEWEENPEEQQEDNPEDDGQEE